MERYWTRSKSVNVRSNAKYTMGLGASKPADPPAAAPAPARERGPTRENAQQPAPKQSYAEKAKKEISVADMLRAVHLETYRLRGQLQHWGGAAVDMDRVPEIALPEGEQARGRKKKKKSPSPLPTMPLPAAHSQQETKARYISERAMQLTIVLDGLSVRGDDEARAERRRLIEALAALEERARAWFETLSKAKTAPEAAAKRPKAAGAKEKAPAGGRRPQKRRAEKSPTPSPAPMEDSGDEETQGGNPKPRGDEDGWVEVRPRRRSKKRRR